MEIKAPWLNAVEGEEKQYILAKMDWPDEHRIRIIQNPHLNADHPLIKTPNELIQLMLSYLDPRSLCHLSETCNMMAAVSEGRHLWMAHLKRDFANDENVFQRHLPRLNPKQAYLQALTDRVEAAKQRERERLAEERHQRMQRYLKRVSLCFHLYEEFCLPWLVPMLATIFAVLAVMQLNRGEDMTWGTMAPFLAIYSCITFAIFILCYVKLLPHPFPFADGTYQAANGFFKLILHEFIGDRNRRGDVVVCSYASLAWLFCIFVCLHATGTVNLTWAGVLSPVFVMLLSLLGIPWIFNWIGHWRRRRDFCVASWILFIMPLLLLLLLLVLRHDHSTFSLAAALTPCWLWNVGSLVLSIFLTVSDRKPVTLLIWLVVVGPMLAFEVSYSVFLDSSSSSLSYVLTFVPFFIWCGFAIVAGIGLGIVIWKDSVGRR